MVHGAWARIGFDAETREEELDLLIPIEDRVANVRLPLVGTLEESLRVSHRDARSLTGGVPSRLVEVEHDHQLRRTLAEPVLSVVLYLCSANAELRADGRDGRPTRPAPRRPKGREPRWVAAPEPVIWETGTRLGAALRRAQAHLVEQEEAAAGGPSLRPHIRRAHWHAFWVGPHDSPDRRRDVRWLPPIPVNLDEDEAPALATIRPVSDER